jgi:hypothetical protein
VQGGRPRAAADEGSGGVERSLVVPGAARRFVLETAMLAPALPVASASGKTFAVVSDPWEGLGELCSRLERAGATVEIVPTHRGTPDQPLPEPVAALLATVDGVVHLGAADPVRPVDARDVFAALQPAIAGRATTLVAAVAPRHRAAAGTASGVPGLLRAVARELPRHHVRAVEVAADQPPGVVARLLADEVLDPAGPASVAYLDGTRTTRRVAKGTSLGSDQPELPFNAGSVIVLTGGARGITARAAVALARATGCRLELLGRSPQPADEDPRTATAPDRPSLRRALIATGELRAPSEIEAACDRIMAAREIRATLHTLSEIGVLATYHAVDVRDGEALGRVLTRSGPGTAASTPSSTAPASSTTGWRATRPTSASTGSSPPRSTARATCWPGSPMTCAWSCSSAASAGSSATAARSTTAPPTTPSTSWPPGSTASASAG